MVKNYNDSSNEIYIYLEKDKHGADQVLATSHADTTYEYEQVTSDDSCKRIRLCDENDISFNKDHSPLGLKLNKTQQLMNSIQVKLSEARKKVVEHEKLKASNFGAQFLQIGSWERWSKHEGDLITKCYYAKKKIVWEILEGALKRKIEIQWSDIIGINAIIRDNEPGILKIELNHPPTYFLETNPQPRKHTLWQTTSDFTRGQAPNYRRHLIVFPPGILDKHYEKLLQCDQRLFEMSHKQFPSLSSPFFSSKISNNNLYELSGHSSCNVNTNVNDIHLMQEYQIQNLSTPSGRLHPFQNFEASIGDCLPYFVDSTIPSVAPQIQYQVQDFHTPMSIPFQMQDFHTPITPYSHQSMELDVDGRTTNYVMENERLNLLSQCTNIVTSQHNAEESDIGNISNYSNYRGLYITEVADSELQLNVMDSLIKVEGVDPCTNNICASPLMIDPDDDQNLKANNLKFMPLISWLPTQQPDTTGAMDSPRNQSLYSLEVFQEPSTQNVEMLNFTLDHYWFK